MIKITQYNAYYSEQDGLHFQVGSKHCWQIKEGYQTAELEMSGHYVNHQKFERLEDALLRLRR